MNVVILGCASCIGGLDKGGIIINVPDSISLNSLAFSGRGMLSLHHLSSSIVIHCHLLSYLLSSIIIVTVTTQKIINNIVDMVLNLQGTLTVGSFTFAGGVLQADTLATAVISASSTLNFNQDTTQYLFSLNFLYYISEILK